MWDQKTTSCKGSQSSGLRKTSGSAGWVKKISISKRQCNRCNGSLMLWIESQKNNEDGHGVGCRILILKPSGARKCEAPIHRKSKKEGQALGDPTPTQGKNSKDLVKTIFGHDSLTNRAIIHICLTQPKLGSIVHSHCLQPLYLRLLAIFHESMEKHIAP